MPSVKSKNISRSVSETVRFSRPFSLETGEVLPEIEIAYTTLGTLNKERDNVVWVFHALTGNADPESWWPGVIGANRFFNPEEYYIVCANILASCYGTTGPVSINPATGKPYLNKFPLVTVRDMVRAHQLLCSYLAIDKIRVGIGGSLGGQQLLEWACEEADKFEIIVPIATNARHSAWGIAFNEAQRMAITADKSFFNGEVTGGAQGLEAARAIAMISYRTREIYDKNQTDAVPLLDDFRASSYQQYQGLKLSRRFNAHSYYTLSKAMDSHNIGRGRGSDGLALRKIQSRAVVVGVESDLLFPVEEQIFIAENIPKANLQFIQSAFGHDAFLVEADQLTRILNQFL